MKHLGNVLTMIALALLGIGAHTVAAQENLLYGFGAAPKTPTAATAAAKQMATHNVSIPLSFEANEGQTAPSVRFLSRGSGYSMFLTQDEVVLNLERQQPDSPALGKTPAVPTVDTLRMKLVGANPSAAIAGIDPLPGVVSYFIGNDPNEWHAGIHTYGKVDYKQVYPGVDLVFYGNQRQLEYDFVVAPGADAGRIAWQIDAARARVDAEGNLVLTAANGPASFKKPVLYQMDGDKRIAVEGSFDVAANKIGFRLGAYDHTKSLIIDPVLSYASYLGGSATDTIGGSVTGYTFTQGLAIDSAGSAYVTGTTYSTNFPVQSPYQSTNNATPSNSRAPTTFVTKFSPDGSALVYSTYLGGGGSGADYAYAIAVDANKEAYVTGQTFSNDFPITAGAYEAFCSPAPKPPSGTPEVSACAPAGNNSAYVTKLNSSGTALVYSTFLGGDGTQYGTSIAVAAAGRAYVGGISYTSCYDGTALIPQGPYPYTCFPTTNGAVISGVPPVGTYGLASPYSFIAVFDPTGADLLYSSLFGTTLNTSGGGTTTTTGVNVDSSGDFYLVGYTVSPNLPTTAGVIQPTATPVAPGNTMPQDRGFIAKFNPVTTTGGASLAYATYLGGQTEFRNDLLNAIVVDSAGNSYVTGFTTSPDFPVTTGSYQTACGAGSGACNADFVVKLNSTATAIDWGTYLGDVTASGDAAQGAGPIALDGNGNVYVTGMAGGSIFPQVNPVEPNANQSEPFVAEFDPTGKSLLFSTIIYSPNASEAAGLGVDASGDIYLAGNINSTGLIVTPGAFQQTFAGSSTIGGYGDGFVLKIAPQGTATVALAASPSPATAGQSVTLTATVTPTETYASVPTGTVEFQNGSTTLGTVALNSAGVATYVTSTLDPGEASLTAAYSGDSTYPTVNGTTTLTVNGLTATVTVTPGSGSVSAGASLSVKVAVTGTGATPTGTVTLLAGSYTSAAETLASGDYSFTIPAGSLTSGTDTITVNYSGDSSYSSATGTASVTVTALLTPTVTVTPGSTSVSAGASLSVKVAVTGSGATPTGTTTLKSGSYTSTAETLTSGSYTFTIPANSLSAGTDTLTVTYSGDSNYSSATGTSSVTVTAVPLTPTVTVTPAVNTLDSGSTLNVSAAVKGAGATPTGTVTLTGGGYTSAAGTLASGSYTFAIPANSLSVGADTLTVNYSGDANYATGTGAASVTVTQSAFTLAASTPTAVAPGAAATSAVTVSTATNYAGTVTLACALTSSPNGATDLPTCSAGSSTVTLSGTTIIGTATVTVTSTSATNALALPKADDKGKGWTAAGGAVLAFMVFLGIPARRRSWRSLTGALALMTVLSSLVACSQKSKTSGSSGTTAGSYTFTVTGTGSPAVTPAPTTTFTVTIN